jgi:hypothetical protein
VALFLASPHPETRTVEIATITGVGSSALGSAAHFASSEISDLLNIT